MIIIALFCLFPILPPTLFHKSTLIHGIFLPLPHSVSFLYRRLCFFLKKNKVGRRKDFRGGGLVASAGFWEGVENGRQDFGEGVENGRNIKLIS